MGGGYSKGLKEAKGRKVELRHVMSIKEREWMGESMDGREGDRLGGGVCACVRVPGCACVNVRVRACVRACVRVPGKGAQGVCHGLYTLHANRSCTLHTRVHGTCYYMVYTLRRHTLHHTALWCKPVLIP